MIEYVSINVNDKGEEKNGKNGEINYPRINLFDGISFYALTLW